MKTIRSLKRFEIVILLVLFLAGTSAIAAWFVASEKITVSSTVKSLTVATYGKASWAQLNVETASIYWSCDPVGFVADTTTGFTAAANTAIYLPTNNHIVNFRAIRSTGSDATLKAMYFE